ncbi:MAG: EamA family transporter [Candidatus Parabeggiatoa sp.]|nr:EamA family transporter [Candidatus Parabeggiatoa sp.]
MNNYIGYIAVLITLVLTMYSQLVIKWQVNNAGELPLDGFGKVKFLLILLLNPWVISAIIATFCSGLSWMLAMSKFELSYAYPFLSLIYAFMMVASVVFLNESLTMNKMIGVFFIMIGIIVLSKG